MKRYIFLVFSGLLISRSVFCQEIDVPVPSVKITIKQHIMPLIKPTSQDLSFVGNLGWHLAAGASSLITIASIVGALQLFLGGLIHSNQRLYIAAGLASLLITKNIFIPVTRFLYKKASLDSNQPLTISDKNSGKELQN